MKLDNKNYLAIKHNGKIHIANRRETFTLKERIKIIYSNMYTKAVNNNNNNDK